MSGSDRETSQRRSRPTRLGSSSHKKKHKNVTVATISDVLISA